MFWISSGRDRENGQIDDSLAESSNQVPPEYKSIALSTDQSARSVPSAYRLNLLFPCMFAVAH